MSDNAKCYAASREFRDTLHQLGARHFLIPPHMPLWTARSSASSAPWTPNGPTAASRPHQPPPRPRPGILHPLLQPPPTTLRRRRRPPITRRSAKPRAGRLGQRRGGAIQTARLATLPCRPQRARAGLCRRLPLDHVAAAERGGQILARRSCASLVGLHVEVSSTPKAGCA